MNLLENAGSVEKNGDSAVVIFNMPF